MELRCCESGSSAFGASKNPVSKIFVALVSANLIALVLEGVSATESGGGGPGISKLKPQIPEALPNITVAVGRDATLPCLVKNLQDYKVAFVHIDRQMILTIHNHVITRIPRFSVSHDNSLTWTLHINKVSQEDRGYYMCQVNTDPMVSTVGFLDVVVPPNIIDSESSLSTVTVRENHNASLICKAEGTPTPRITWRREDNKKIIIKRKKNAGKKEKRLVVAESLDLIRISRTEMGAYLCIAQNGIPPSISKRIILNVEFSPMIWIPNQLVGAPLGTDVQLECHTESSPKAIAYWIFRENMVLSTARHRTEDKHHSNYKLDSRLHIKNLKPEDYGSYRCVSKNSLGETEGSIMLYELETPTEAPKSPQIISVFGDYEGDTNVIPVGGEDELSEEDYEDDDEEEDDLPEVERENLYMGLDKKDRMKNQYFSDNKNSNKRQKQRKKGNRNQSFWTNSGHSGLHFAKSFWTLATTLSISTMTLLA